MGYPILVALAAVGLSCLAGGSALLLARRAPASGALLMVGGAALMLGAAVSGAGSSVLADRLFAVASCLACPLAVATYPRLRLRRPVDFLAVVAITGAGTVLLVQPSDPGVASAMGFTIASVLVAHTWWRIERADEGDRGPLLWMAFALIASSLACGVAVFSAEGGTGRASDVVVAIGFSLLTVVPWAMYVGSTRPEVVDVRGLIVSGVVFAVAIACYVSIFVAAASFLEILGGRRPLVGVLGVVGALAATTLHPLQVVLRGVVDRLLFGERPDPLGAASHVVDHIGGDPVLALRALRESLVLPYAALRVGGVELATSGVPVTHTRTLPLALGSDSVGELEVGLRAGDLGLSQGDEHVLKLVAPLLAQTLRATALSVDLQSSREQTVTALEEERRRLRRDLHDGLGPRLSGIAFTSDAARNTLRHDPDRPTRSSPPCAARRPPRSRRSDSSSTAMRPPALDELGLVPALRQQVDQLRTPDGRPMRVTLDASRAARPDCRGRGGGVPHHDRGPHQQRPPQRLGRGDRHPRRARRPVVIEVEDDGVSTDPWQPGVGLASMRERASRAGGHLDRGRKRRARRPAVGEASARDEGGVSLRAL